MVELRNRLSKLIKRKILYRHQLAGQGLGSTATDHRTGEESMLKHMKTTVWLSEVFAGKTVLRQGRSCRHRNCLISFFLLISLCFLPIAYAQVGQPYQISGEMVTSGDVIYHQISADSSRVVYHSDQETDDVYELYSVPIAGGPAVKLNDLLVAGGYVYSYQISTGSSRVVYLADQESDNVYELYSVPIAGGPAVKLNGLLVAGGDVD